MVVLYVSPRADEASIWRRLLLDRLDDVDFRTLADLGDPSDVDVILAWKPPPGVIATFPHLKLVCSLGMGVDHLLDDPTLPQDVPVVRLVDPDMIAQMSEYALYSVLHFHRGFDVYRRFQDEGRWEELPLQHTTKRRVGVMGLGAIGLECARRIAALGFDVRGWSRTRKEESTIECFHGFESLPLFLHGTHILLVVLPLTAETAGIIDERMLSFLPPGSYIVNIARGGLVVEKDLLHHLDKGRVAGAFLDVTQIEPLPRKHPFWDHPGVRLTPHIAGLTNPETAIEAIVENLRRLRAGETLLNRVDRCRGY